MQMVKRKGDAAADTHSITIDIAPAQPGTPRPGPLGPDQGAAPMTFSVTYRLRDYLTILREHVTLEARRRAKRQAGALTRLALPVWIALVGIPVYAIKRLRMPVCEFSIDHAGISRLSAAGKLSRPWSELVEARAYSTSYLLVFKKGAIPVPYRCLGAQQMVRMRAVLAQVQAAGR